MLEGKGLVAVCGDTVAVVCDFYELTAIFFETDLCIYIDREEVG